MIRTHLQCALAAAALLLSSGAMAQSTPSNAAPVAPHTMDKAGTNGKAAVDTKGAAPGLAAKEADRAVRVKAQQDSERQQLRTALRAPMTDAQKQDLRLHAERVAKLERIKSLAADAKDAATVDRATKLLDQESTRYEKWLNGLSTKADTTGSSQAKVGGQ